MRCHSGFSIRSPVVLSFHALVVARLMVQTAVPFGV